MIHTGELLNQLSRDGIQIQGVNPDGKTIRYKLLRPLDDATKIRLRQKILDNKPSLIQYFSESDLGKVRSAIQTDNAWINKKAEPDATKHPIENFLYPESVTAKGLLAIPSLVGAAGLGPETILGAMAAGGAEGAGLGFASGEGTLQGAGQGLLTGLKLPGSKASDKAVAAAYDKGMSTTLAKILSYMPNTSRMLLSGKKKWWDVLRMSEHDDPNVSNIAQKEVGTMYSDGMGIIKKKLDAYGAQKARDIDAAFTAKYGFSAGPGSRPTAAQFSTPAIKDAYLAARQAMQQAKHTGLAFQRTVKQIQEEANGAYRQLSGVSDDILKHNNTAKKITNDIADKNEKIEKILSEAGEALNENLSGDFQTLKDQYSKFKTVQSAARHVAEKGPITMRGGGIRTNMADMMDWLNKERETIPNKLKSDWPEFKKAVLRNSDFSEGMDVEGKPFGSGITAYGGVGHLPRILAHPIQMIMNRPIRVGDLPAGRIPEWLAKSTGRIGGALAGQSGLKLANPSQEATPDASNQ